MATIGLSAALTPGLTVHTAAFESAANEVLRRISVEARESIKAEWVCDRMCADGGREAALEMVRRGVHAVVGHFSSQAAQAAIPIYRDHQIPLILPCSSQDDLTNHQGAGSDPCFVFRLSASDTGLFHAVQRFLTKMGVDRPALAVWSADGAYGARLSSVAGKVLGETPKSMPSVEPRAWLLLGHHADVAGKISALRAAGTTAPLIIMDDAVDANLHRQVEWGGLAGVFGVLATLPGQPMGTKEIPFRRETDLAVEVTAKALLSGKRGAELARLIGSSEWKGTAGSAVFGLNGDNQCIDYGLWMYRDGAFNPSALI